MARSRSPRDSRLLDALDELPSTSFSGTAWRVTREGHDPIQCNAVGGRWDDRTFDVLYTSTKADGAIAEMFFHVSRGQPVIPSLVRYLLHELTVRLASCLKLSLAALRALGLQTAGFGQLSYFEREQEYLRTQEIAEIAYFLGRDGLIVPSARSAHDNLIVFCEPAGLPESIELIRDHGEIDWEHWRSSPLGY
jgi:RES domain-containing protein